MATKTKPVTTRLTAEQVATLIALPLWDWPGNCYGVAAQLAVKIGGEVCYGNWNGPIAATFPMKGRRMKSMFADKPFCHHAWIEQKGQVIDPTRWVFEGVEPYIYYGKNDHYDFGGNGFRDATLGPPPDPYMTEQPETYYPEFGNAIDRVHELLQYNGKDGYSWEQLMWLANASPKRIGEFYVAEVYEALIAIDMEALIPLDSRRRYAR